MALTERMTNGPSLEGKPGTGTPGEEYFHKPANYHDDSRIYNPKLAKVGRNGPLDVAISDMVPELEEFRQALSKAWVSKGERLTEKIYEGQVNGLVKCTNTIYKGVRSTSACFLDGKPNITVLAETRAKKLIIENDQGTGVLLIDEAGNEFRVHAKREVILSSGVFEVSCLPVSQQAILFLRANPEASLPRYSCSPELAPRHSYPSSGSSAKLTHLMLAKTYEIIRSCPMSSRSKMGSDSMATY